MHAFTNADKRYRVLPVRENAENYVRKACILSAFACRSIPMQNGWIGQGNARRHAYNGGNVHAWDAGMLACAYALVFTFAPPTLLTQYRSLQKILFELHISHAE